MSTTSDTCPTCSCRGVDALHLSRCAYQADLKARLIERATERGVGPVEARDLMAHLRDLGDDGTEALNRTLTVIDLGWRPADARDM